MHRKEESGRIPGCESMACAIVELAAKDYKYALEKLRMIPDDYHAQRTIEDCERFFREEMKRYSDLDGETVIRAIRERVDEGSKQDAGCKANQ